MQRHHDLIKATCREIDNVYQAMRNNELIREVTDKKLCILKNKRKSIKMEVSPLLARSRAVSFPMPVFAPVIRTVLPLSKALLLHTPPAKYHFIAA